MKLDRRQFLTGAGLSIAALALPGLAHALPVPQGNSLSFRVTRKGSEIGAEAEIRIRPTTQGLASVALQLTPVWQNDYIGLNSSEFFGRAQIGTGRIKLLRTPRFHLPGPLQRLSVSLLMHFLPGADLIADADVDVLSIALKRSDPPAPSDPA